MSDLNGSGASYGADCDSANVGGFLLTPIEVHDARVEPLRHCPPDFVYRPLSVGEPFALGEARSVPLAIVRPPMDPP